MEKRLTTVQKIIEKVNSAPKKHEAIITGSAAMPNKGSVESFLKMIGDNALNLKDKVIEDNTRAILLLLVNNEEHDLYEVLAICFSKSKNIVTDISFFNYRNCSEIENYVADRILGTDYMGKIADVCNVKSCTYSFEKNKVYSLDKEDNKHPIANLNPFVTDITNGILDAAEKDNENIYEAEIEGTKYITIDKEYVFAALGKNKNCICRLLAKLGLIYTNQSGGKTRYYYRERTKGETKDENKEIHEVNYFAIDLEQLCAAYEECEQLC